MLAFQGRADLSTYALKDGIRGFLYLISCLDTIEGQGQINPVLNCAQGLPWIKSNLDQFRPVIVDSPQVVNKIRDVEDP